jgi:hypothetical protein
LSYKLIIISLIWVRWLIGYDGFAQSSFGDSIVIRATLPKNKVEQKDDLLLRVVVINTSDHSFQAYEKLVEGYASDNNMNFNLLIEKEEKGKFVLYRNRSLYQKIPTDDSADYIPKIPLAPKDSMAHFYHLDNVYMFDVGNYRVKCTYSNNIRKKDKVASDWHYFAVKKKIYVTKYYE